MAYLIINVILGLICAMIASSKGRSGIGWFFIGFFFGILGLIISLVVGDLNAAKEKELEMDNEQRRLREQLRQERIKNDQFRKHAQGRLDEHDDALGIDTRNIQELPETDSQKLPELDPQEKLSDTDNPYELPREEYEV